MIFVLEYLVKLTLIEFNNHILFINDGEAAMKMIKFILLIVILSSCGSAPIKPEGKNVEVKREKPSGDDCDDLGDVEGRSMSVKGSFEEALADLKNDVALKGGNYIHLMSTSGLGTAVRGRAYFCK